jgi:hypothetical protein
LEDEFDEDYFELPDTVDNFGHENKASAARQYDTSIRDFDVSVIDDQRTVYNILLLQEKFEEDLIIYIDMAINVDVDDHDKIVWLPDGSVNIDNVRSCAYIGHLRMEFIGRKEYTISKWTVGISVDKETAEALETLIRAYLDGSIDDNEMPDALSGVIK